jgi:hypothetical protein
MSSQTQQPFIYLKWFDVCYPRLESRRLGKHHDVEFLRNHNGGNKIDGCNWICGVN